MELIRVDGTRDYLAGTTGQPSASIKIFIFSPIAIHNTIEKIISYLNFKINIFKQIGA